MRNKYRGNWFNIAVTLEVMTITREGYELKATKVSLPDTVYELKPGETLMFDLHKKASKGGPN